MTTTASEPRVVPVFMVVPPRALLLDVAGPVEVLRRANAEQTRLRYDVTTSARPATVQSSVGLTLAGLAPLPQTLPLGSLVIVSGSADEPLGPPPDRAADARDEAAVVAWLARTVGPGVRLATVCSGALLAARAGLFDGRKCTTHHAAIDDLARLAPLARVRENRLYVGDGERMSSAGISAGVDLMLHLVAADLGPAVAVAVARHLVVYLRRAGSDPQLSPWLEGRNHLHPAIHRAQDAVAADPARGWSVDSLADVANTSRRTLSRLFNEQTGMSVTDYVNRMRIALARQLVLHTGADMETVAERAGYGSARQFRRAWNRLNDGPPSGTRRAGPSPSSERAGETREAEGDGGATRQ